MGTWLKILLGVAGGFAAGFACGFITCKKVNDIQFEETSEEDFDALLKDLPEEVQNLSKASSEVAEKALKRAAKAMDEAAGNVDKLRNAMQGKTPYMQADDAKKQEYSKMWNSVKEYSNEENANDIPTQGDDEEPEGDDQEFLDNLEADIHDEIEEPETKEKPYQITLGEFYQERREYDKNTIDWYDGDNVVLDEQEEVIANVVAYVGCSMKELFGEAPLDGDPDSRFVRNDRYGSDYEVIRHHGSYRELAGGAGLD